MEVLQRRFENLDRVLSGHEFVALLWGPGKDNDSHIKRQQIKAHLKNVFKNATVVMSEDNEIRKHSRPRFDCIINEELAHAEVADIIFALDCSHGVGEEIAKYSEYPIVASRLVVLTHQRHLRSKSFSAEVRQRLELEPYTDKQFETSLLGKVICVRRVRSFLLKKHMFFNGRQD